MIVALDGTPDCYQGYNRAMNEQDVSWRLGVLRSNSWFRTLPADALLALARGGRSKRLASGELFATRGVPIMGIAIVIRGALRTSTLTAEGREVVFSMLQPGQVWGLVASIDGGGAIHDTRAHGKTEVLLLPRGALLSVLNARPRLYSHFLRLLCSRLRNAYNAVDDFALVPVRQRLARQLCNLAMASEQGRARHGNVELRFTQSEIALMLGAARPTVNRELRRLQEEGMLQVGYRTVAVKQFTRLSELSDSQGI